MNLVSLSLAFQGVAKPESSYRRIKRFFSEVSLDKTAVARFILSFLPPPPYTLCVDRTNWRFGTFDINILVIAVAYRGIAFPLVWRLLEKKGNSSSEERIDLLADLLRLINPKDIAFFLADREFIGVTWFNYLDKRRVPFAIRIRKDSLCDNWCAVSTLFAPLPGGELKILAHSYNIYGCSLRLAGMKLAHQDYAIIATNRMPAQAFLAYQRRWEIEMLFSAFKTTGFDVEATHLTKLYKLDTLVALLTLAFFWAHYVGEWLHDTRTKPLRLKSHRRREKSFFRHGLDHLRYLLKNLPLKHPDLRCCVRLLSRTVGDRYTARPFRGCEVLPSRIEAALDDPLFGLKPTTGLLGGGRAAGKLAPSMVYILRFTNLHRASASLAQPLGTRLRDETGDLALVADYLRHTSLDTARGYAKASHVQLKKALGEW